MKHSTGELLASGRRYIVKALPKNTTTRGGLILPDTVKDRIQVTMSVIELGTHVPTPGDPATNYVAAVGDKVIISPHAGATLTIEDEEYKVIGELDIVAVIKPLNNETLVNRSNKAVLV